MSNVVLFAILGLASGALYVLLALGIVVVYRASGVVNFAQGAIAMAATFVFWELNQQHGVPYGIALVVGLAAGAILGLLVQLCVMYPLRRASSLSRIIATLAVLTVLEQIAALRYTTPLILPPSELPTSTVTVFGANLGIDRLIILGIVFVIVAVLFVVYRSTTFGLATSGTSENPRTIAALGYSPGKIAAINWAVGGLLAGLAGILLAPIIGLNVTLYTLLVVTALSAAIVGRLVSFPLTVLGGLAVGVLQSETSRWVTSVGVSESVPLVVILVILIVRGSRGASRTQEARRLPRLGTGRLRPAVVVPGLVGLGLLVGFGLSSSWNDAVTTTMIAALIALSLVVLTGYSGQLSLAQFAFAGWGAWIAGEFASSFGWSFPAALAVGALLTLPLGIVIGIICLRTSGVNLAIATLALSVALYALVFNNPARTGQNGGLNVGNPTVAGLNVGAVDHPNRYGLVVIVAFVIAGIVVRNIRRGSAGRRLLAVRGNERAAASLGIGVAGARLYAFGVSSVIAAVGGILLVFRDPSATYTGFGPLGSIQVVVEAVVGGVGWILGAVAGGVLEVGGVGTQILNAIGGGSQYLPLIGGVLLLLTMLHAQDGVASKLWDQGRAVLRHIWTEKGGGNGKVPDEVAEENAWVEPVRAARLLVDDLTVRFGAVTAVSGVSLVVEPGEIVGVIGPNGAGKTTLIDAITGFVPSRCGRMELGEVALEKLSVSKRSRAGVTRSFQSLELFDEMTVLDNLRSAGEPRNRMSYLRDLVYPRTPRLPSETLAAIHVFGLEEHLNSLPSVLPQGTRRLVAIARAVSTAPSVLLLDEPAAGLDDRAAEELGSLIRQLATAWGMGILLVEHNVDMVMSVCDRIYVLDFGACIASGAPASIRQDPRVVASYLGEASTDASPAESPAL